MTRQGSRLGRVLGTLAVATLGIVGFAAPAQAEPTGGDSAEACWLDIESGAYECFESEAAWYASLEEQGYVLVVDGEAVTDNAGEAARGGAGLLTIYLLATMYQDANYGGNQLGITTSNSWACTGTDYNGNMPTGWNDAVSSFQSYLGCRTRLASDINQGGSFYGPAVSAASLGGFNDVASSYRVMD